ncbi:hypothetical protein ACOME3_001575 [Neoechinorhynchus agilis]
MKLSSVQREKEMELSNRHVENKQKINKLEKSLKKANEKLDAKIKSSADMEKQFEEVRKKNEEIIIQFEDSVQLISDLKAKLTELKEINDQMKLKESQEISKMQRLKGNLKQSWAWLQKSRTVFRAENEKLIIDRWIRNPRTLWTLTRRAAAAGIRSQPPKKSIFVDQYLKNVLRTERDCRCIGRNTSW